MGVFFDNYKKYYDALQNSATGNAKNLATDCDKWSKIINNDLTEIKISDWNEKGKSIFNSSICNGLENNIKSLCDFVSHNLVKACELSDNLYEKVVEIKSNDDDLDKKRALLSGKENELQQLKIRRSNITLRETYIENGTE